MVAERQLIVKILNTINAMFFGDTVANTAGVMQLAFVIIIACLVFRIVRKYVIEF